VVLGDAFLDELAHVQVKRESEDRSLDGHLEMAMEMLGVTG
jgi:hypothetical protein